MRIILGTIVGVVGGFVIWFCIPTPDATGLIAALAVAIPLGGAIALGE